MQQAFLLTFIIFFLGAAATPILPGQVCTEASCPCSPLSDDFAVQPIDCFSGQTCDIRDGKPVCFRRRFTEYQMNAEVYPCSNILCLNGEYCQTHSSKTVCSKTSLSMYKIIYSKEKCMDAWGCLCQPDPEDDQTWRILAAGLDCSRENDFLEATICNTDHCFCHPAQADCTRNQYCIGGNFRGCSYDRELGKTPIRPMQVCKDGAGCGCIPDPNPKSVSLGATFCTFGQVCRLNSIPTLLVQTPTVYASCGFPTAPQQIGCWAQSCLFTTQVTCIRGQYFLQKAKRCISKPLIELPEVLKDGDRLAGTCNDPRGCVCKVSRKLFHGRAEHHVLIQKTQVCQQTPLPNRTGLFFAPPKANMFECTEEFCLCNDNPDRGTVLFCTQGQICHLYLNTSACKSPEPTAKMVHTLYRLII